MDRQQITSHNIISEIIGLKKKFSSSENIEIVREIQENVRKIDEQMNKKSEQNKNELRSEKKLFLTTISLLLLFIDFSRVNSLVTQH